MTERQVILALSQKGARALDRVLKEALEEPEYVVPGRSIMEAIRADLADQIERKKQHARKTTRK